MKEDILSEERALLRLGYHLLLQFKKDLVSEPIWVEIRREND